MLLIPALGVAENRGSSVQLRLLLEYESFRQRCRVRVEVTHVQVRRSTPKFFTVVELIRSALPTKSALATMEKAPITSSSYSRSNVANRLKNHKALNGTS